MRPKSVLIADDDRDLVQALELRCRQLGLKSIVAHDATTALNLAHEHRPDLICLDVNMPRGSGLSACEMLANDEQLSSIPVIILTGQTDEETIRRCHSMCAYYVLKSSDIWQRAEPIICEILGIQPNRSNADIGSADSARDHSTATTHPPLDEWRESIVREVAFAQLGDTEKGCHNG